MGPDRNKHLRNAAIVLALAVAVWKVPGGGTASATISNIFSVLFLAGLFFLGYRVYMERRETLFGLEERQRGLMYGALALAVFAIVATRRLWDAGGLGAMLWLLMLGASGWALYSVWRAYNTERVRRRFRASFGTLSLQSGLDPFSERGKAPAHAHARHPRPGPTTPRPHRVPAATAPPRLPARPRLPAPPRLPRAASPARCASRAAASPCATASPRVAAPPPASRPAHASGLARTSRSAGPPSLLSSRGQASVELVVLLPVIVVVLAVGYQAVLAGQAVWEVRVAARAAARAHAFGGDPRAAARSHLRSGLERGLRVSAEDEGDVRISVRVPTVIPSIRLGRVSATSHFRPQSG